MQYGSLYRNPRVHYRMFDLDGLRTQLQNPEGDAHRARILALITQKEKELEEIFAELNVPTDTGSVT